MIYEVLVTIKNSPTKVKQWGYLINADNEITAGVEALNLAKIKAHRPYSRYRKCTFTIAQGDCKARPDW